MTVRAHEKIRKSHSPIVIVKAIFLSSSLHLIFQKLELKSLILSSRLYLTITNFATDLNAGDLHNSRLEVGKFDHV